MQIYLIHLIDKFNLGGSTTYLIHLYQQLLATGYEPIIITKGKKISTREYYGITINRLPENLIITIAKHSPSIITYCFWKENWQLATKLIKMNVPMVMHDPAEFHTEWIEIAKKYGKYVVIRDKNRKNLNEYGIQSQFIPHPYVSTEIRNVGNKLAVCAARIDFRKHTSIVCEYNDIYDEPIDLYGEVNRMYDYLILQKKFPSWKANYKGTIPTTLHQQAQIISGYRYAIDLTAIKQDGGGTQYCFLEAWNAGCLLILNKKWDCANSILEDRKNCIYIEDVKELAYVLQNKVEYDTEYQTSLLSKHKAENVIPQYLNLIQ